jgi:hypothetical protein
MFGAIQTAICAPSGQVIFGRPLVGQVVIKAGVAGAPAAHAFVPEWDFRYAITSATGTTSAYLTAMS